MRASGQNNQKGFTLIELLVTMAILAVLTSIVVIIINPLEILRKARDSERLQDLDGIYKSLHLGVLATTGNTAFILCDNITPPCKGFSNEVGDMKKNDGSGWVKVNLAVLTSNSVLTLPLDPKNDSSHFYTYGSDGLDYEFNTVLESEDNRSIMEKDGGDDPNVYEIGSSLTVIN